MGNMHLVTGLKGEGHVTSADVGSLNASIFGTGEYVLDRGSKFAATIISNNKIRIADGDIMMQGRHIRLNEGTYVELTIENGQASYFRNDLIVVRYTKDSETNVEDANLVVIKGSPVASSPADPEYTVGDIINNHVFLADMPLYRVPLEGLTVGTLVPLFEESGINIPDGSIGAEKLADGAVTKHFTAQIGTVWTGEAAPYTQEIAVSGILASDVPIVDMVTSDTYSAVEAEEEAWANVYKIQTAANKITVYAKEATETAINIQMVVNRK